MVFSFGSREGGQLGHGENLIDTEEGTPSLIDITYIGDRKVVQVSAGNNYSLFLCEDGTVFSSGLGVFGQLGNGNTYSNDVGTSLPIDYKNIRDCKVIQVTSCTVKGMKLGMQCWRRCKNIDIVLS